ncbi:MAG: polysaccharide deacetylase family protein [Planctomycetota bacterium]
MGRANPVALRAVIVAGGGPRQVSRLILELQRRCPGIEVAGVVHDQVNAISTRQPPHSFVEWLAASNKLLSWMGHLALDILHGGRPTQGDEQLQLRELCDQLHLPIHEAAEGSNGDETEAFIASLRCDLGIIYDAARGDPLLITAALDRICVVEVPTMEEAATTINSLSQDNHASCIASKTVYRVNTSGQAVRATSLPVHRYDTATSLYWKSRVIGIDLLASTLNGDPPTPSDSRQTDTPPSIASTGEPPVAADTAAKDAVGQTPVTRAPFVASPNRPLWKLFYKSLRGFPEVVWCNWRNRRQRTYPVHGLFHHLVSERQHFLALPTDQFLRHLRFLKRHYRLVNTREAHRLLRSGLVDEPTVMLTFDDGYADNHLNLRALALAIDFPATLFVCSQHVEQGKPFEHDLQDNLIGFQPLTWDQIRDLHAWGFEIGSHTRNHQDCGDEKADLEREIVLAQDEIAAQIGAPVNAFSFPYGLPENICSRAVHIATGQYDMICSAFGGTNRPTSSSKATHLRRSSHVRNLWEVELTLQEMLERHVTEHPVLDQINEPTAKVEQAGSRATRVPAG